MTLNLQMHRELHVWHLIESLMLHHHYLKTTVCYRMFIKSTLANCYQK